MFDTADVGHPDDHADLTACGCLVESLDVYHEYRVEEGADALRGDWTTLASVLAGDASTDAAGRDR